MSLDVSHLLDLAAEKPERIDHAVEALDNHERLVLLDQVASRGLSRRFADVLRGKGKREDQLGIGKEVTVFLAKTSFPALGSFQLHMFRDAKKRVWGRTVTTAPTFVGPGYFGVKEGEELVLDYDQVPPPDVAVPKGWPPVVSNSAGLAAIALAGTSLHLRGSGRGLLTGSVWRNGRDQGVFVNLVRSR